jgi:hypothetical protein
MGRKVLEWALYGLGFAALFAAVVATIYLVSGRFAGGG